MIELDEGRREYLAKYRSEPDAEEVVGAFWKIRSRAKSPENDIDWWIKKPFGDLKKFVDGFDTRKRSARRSDEYSKKAEKYGAVLMDEKDGYEIWYVPSYEAAVQLGRFYRNISAKWCISTDNPTYFSDNYRDSEFMFLIWAGAGPCPYPGAEKLALQVDSAGLDDGYGLWDTGDTDISGDDDFLESPLAALADRAVSLFGSVPYDRKGWSAKAVALYAADDEWLRANVFGPDCSFARSEDGGVSAEYPVSDVVYALDDALDRKFVTNVLRCEFDPYSYGMADYDTDYDLPAAVTGGFDELMKPYGISWKTVSRIARGETVRIQPRRARIIEEMLEDDFYEGNSYAVCYSDAMASGTAQEARDDILRQLAQIGVDSCGPDAGGEYVLKCSYSRDTLESIVRERLDFGPADHVFQLAVREDGEGGEISLSEPQYGWSGLDIGMMEEALAGFADALTGQLTIRRDAPGQMHFDFDRDAVDNPRNLPRRTR